MMTFQLRAVDAAGLTHTTWSSDNETREQALAECGRFFPEGGPSAKSPAAEARSRRWEAEFITCDNHPHRRCNRSKYVLSRTRRCSSCANHRADGSPRPAFVKCRRAYD